MSPEHIEAITAFTQMQMLEACFATNVEFHYIHHQADGIPYTKLSELSDRIASATLQTGIGLTLLPVHDQYGGLDKRPLGAGQVRFGTDLDQFAKLFADASESVASLPKDCRIGVAPHSLRAVAPESLASLAVLTDGPLHMHLAEQIAEVDEVETILGCRPVEWVLDNMPICPNTCFIHCTQMLPHETQRLAKTGAIAGLCTITESNLGDGIFDGVRWFENDGKTAIGSDSNIRLSLCEELRTLDYSQRLRDHTRSALATTTFSTGRRFLEAVTTGGALAANRRTGKIAPGYYADLVALDGQHVDLAATTGDITLDSFVFTGDNQMIKAVWSAVRHKVEVGQHIAREAITQRYKRDSNPECADLTVLSQSIKDDKQSTKIDSTGIQRLH